MPERPPTDTPEEQFRDAFAAVLEKALERVAQDARGRLGPARVSETLFRAYNEMRAWPEATRSFRLAQASPVLRRLTWDAAGKPIDSVDFWVNQTVFSAVERYWALASPSGHPLVSSHKGRVRRILAEVFAWAKLDTVPVVTTTLVHGLRTDGNRRFRIAPNTVLRASTLEEWEPLLRGGEIVPQPLCIETKEELPRLQSRPPGIPYPFLQALQLILNSPVMLANTIIQAAVPTFSLSNLGGQLVRPHSQLHMLLDRKLVTSREISMARRLSDAFRDLHNTGFELALGLWVSSLHRATARERAVDIAIALENLYLPDSRSELRYRFSLHVAAFGTRLSRNERLTMKMGRDLYDARSSVVHAGTPSPDNINLLNGVGARLVRSTLRSIAAKGNRAALKDIADRVRKRIEK